jgi:prepilin-type N-terminal cleavage/methylation domain-containing protein
VIFVKKAGGRSDTEAEEMGDPSGSLAAMTFVDFAPAPRSQAGFTLVELLVVISITAILLTLSAAAARTFWLNQALTGAASDLRLQLGQLHQRAQAESHPRVYGAWFVQGSSSWGLVRYTATTNNCTPVESRSFDSGVTVSDIQGFDLPTGLVSACRSALQTSGVSGATSARIAFFYARGTATAGSVTVRQPSLGRTRTVQVHALTGRVA